MKSKVRNCANTVNRASYITRILMKRRKGLRFGSYVGGLGWSKSSKKGSGRRKFGSFRQGNFGCCLPLECRALLQNRLNFERSGIPQRLMFFWQGDWIDFPAEATEDLKRCFLARNSCVKVEIDGSSYLVDFLRMLQIDLSAGCQRSISWIDCDGKCFFPKIFVGENGMDGEAHSSPLKLEIEIRIDKTQGSKVVNEVGGGEADRLSEVSKTRDQKHLLLTQSQIKVADDDTAIRRLKCQESVNLTNTAKVKEITNSICAGLAAGLKKNEVSAKCINGMKPVSMNCPSHVQTNNFTDGFCDFLRRKPTSIKRTLDYSANATEGKEDEMCGDGSIARKRICVQSIPCSSVAVSRTPKLEPLSDNFYENKLPCEGEYGFSETSSELKAGNGTVAEEFRGSPASASNTVKNSSGLTACFSLEQAKSEQRLPPVSDLDENKLPCTREDGSLQTSLQTSSEHRVGNSMGTHNVKEETQSVAEEFLGFPTSDTDSRKSSSCVSASSSLEQAKLGKHGLLPVCHGNQMQALKPLSCSAEKLPLFALLGTKLAKLEENDKAYASVKNLFLGGIGKVDSRTTVSAIYQCLHESPLGRARFLAFQRHVEMTKNSRGHANVKYAWHGTSAKGVESIVLHGFGQPKTCCDSGAYGIGIYLSPEGFSHLSASCAVPDNNGEQHVLLCRVIMGNVENVQAGSSQFHPSDESFDTGSDNLSNPRYYIVWSTHMNTHILPEYIVSFKVSDHLREFWRTKMVQDSRGLLERRNSSTEIAKSTSRPPFLIVVPEKPHTSIDVYGQIKEKVPTLGVTPNMSFPALFSVMERSLNQSDIGLIKHLYIEFKAGKVGKDILIRKIRSIAGDKLLIDAINIIRSQGDESFFVPVSLLHTLCFPLRALATTI